MNSEKHSFPNPTRNIEDDFMRSIYHEIDRDCGIRDYDCITYDGFWRVCACGQEYRVNENDLRTKQHCHVCVLHGHKHRKCRVPPPG